MIVERACKYVIYGTEAEIMAIRSLIGKTSFDSRCELGMKSDEALLLEDVYRTLDAALGKEDESCERLS
jgi:hypothetical protein